MLHGPILAKNTWLADQIIEKVRGNSPRNNVNTAKLDQIESLAKAARELAAEQAKG
jgi:CobQ-like glutamine amidotransferase family enzyme